MWEAAEGGSERGEAPSVKVLMGSECDISEKRGGGGCCGHRVSRNTTGAVERRTHLGSSVGHEE